MVRKFILLFLLSAFAILSSARVTFAAGVVGNGTPASCTGAALQNALNHGGAVTFDCGAAVKTILLNKNITIAQNTTVNGGNKIELEFAANKRMRVKSGATLVLQNIVIQNAVSEFGAVENFGVLTLRHVHMRNNTSTNFGGAIHNHGALKIRRSTFSQNSADHHGGAIYSNGGNLNIKTSTFYGNHAINGGGIFTDLEAGKLVVNGTTFYDNTADYAGAGMYTNTESLITNSTFTNNSAPYASGYHRDRGDATLHHVTFGTNPSAYGAGLSSQTSNGTLYLQNSVLASADYNCSFGIYVSQGNNVASDAQCSFLTASGDQQNTNAKLGALANNGGPTLTHLPAADSPLLNAGTATNLKTDQRGMPRPVGIADIGAVEVQ